MKTAFALLFATAFWALPALCTAPVRVAVIIGQPHSPDPDVPDLHYADDDALAFAHLLDQSGAHTTLLTTFDEDTRRLHPHAQVFAPPTKAALKAALDRAFGVVRRAQARGLRAEFLFVYSGHGDVDNGEGHVWLEDGRLTRSRLVRDVLAPSPAAVNHVVVDACKSYFFAFDKGPGGRRVQAPADWSDHSDVLRRTGFVLSTSSAKNSHEWDGFQAGVFSHELRSALRGGADLDVDGHVTYDEVGAFLWTANHAIINPQLRPDFFVLAPAEAPDDTALLDWTRTADLDLDHDGIGRVYVEDREGRRILDVHPAEGGVQLHLPQQRPLFVRVHGEDQEYTLTSQAPQRLSLLSQGPAAILIKGAQGRAFGQLFTVAHGADALDAYRQDVRTRSSALLHWTMPAVAPHPPELDNNIPFASFALISGFGVASLASAAVFAGSALVVVERTVSTPSSQLDARRRNQAINVATVIGGAAGLAIVPSVVGLSIMWWAAKE